MNRPVKPILLTDFSDFSHQQWRIVNDGVMGGISEGQFQINSDGHALFLGHVSLENNGGFTMVRNHEQVNLHGFSSIATLVRGDGKRYKFRLKTGDSPERIHSWSYECPFISPREEWSEVVLPLENFIPVYRGRKLSDVPPLDPASVYQYGFLISDKQEGEFRLEIQSIKAHP